MFAWFGIFNFRGLRSLALGLMPRYSIHTLFFLCPVPVPAGPGFQFPGTGEFNFQVIWSTRSWGRRLLCGSGFSPKSTGVQAAPVADRYIRQCFITAAQEFFMPPVERGTDAVERSAHGFITRKSRIAHCAHLQCSMFRIWEA
jgi:hypothetical protein